MVVGLPGSSGDLREWRWRWREIAGMTAALVGICQLVMKVGVYHAVMRFLYQYLIKVD